VTTQRGWQQAQGQQEPAAPKEPHPLVISSRPESQLQARRPLYEALLQLEQHGVVLVERLLRLVDVVLSPSSCLCLLAGQELQQLQAQAQAQLQAAGGNPSSSAALASATAVVASKLMCARLHRLSYAFSGIIFLVEGPEGLMMPLLECNNLMQAAAGQLGVRLQLLTSTTASVTQQVVAQLCSDYAASCRAAPGARPLRIRDTPPPAECFLCALPMLNPLSAARLLCSGLVLRDILGLAAEGQRLAEVAPDVPPHCLELLQAATSAVVVNIEPEPEQPGWQEQAAQLQQHEQLQAWQAARTHQEHAAAEGQQELQHELQRQGPYDHDLEARHSSPDLPYHGHCYSPVGWDPQLCQQQQQQQQRLAAHWQQQQEMTEEDEQLLDNQLYSDDGPQQQQQGCRRGAPSTAPGRGPFHPAALSPGLEASNSRERGSSALLQQYLAQQHHQGRYPAGPRVPQLTDPGERPFKRPRTKRAHQGYTTAACHHGAGQELAMHGTPAVQRSLPGGLPDRRGAPRLSSWDDASAEADMWQASIDPGGGRGRFRVQPAAGRRSQHQQSGAGRGRGGRAQEPDAEPSEFDELFQLEDSPLPGEAPGLRRGGAPGLQQQRDPQAQQEQRPQLVGSRSLGDLATGAHGQYGWQQLATAAGPGDVLEQYLHNKQAARGAGVQGGLARGAPQASLADLGLLGGGVDEGLTARARLRAALMAGPKRRLRSK
jgi:hypothetical protein